MKMETDGAKGEEASAIKRAARVDNKSSLKDTMEKG